MSMAGSTALTLVVGATGNVGRQVVHSLLGKGTPVRCLVRPASDSSSLEAQGATVVRGDMMNKASLDKAFEGVDAVVLCAAGYMARKKGDSRLADTQGNQNVIDAAMKAGVRRIVFLSILKCDDVQALDVPHFKDKADVETYLRHKSAPFVALRPGAFLDQGADTLPQQLASGALLALAKPDVPFGWVLSSDLSACLAAAVSLPTAWDGSSIELGWDRPMSYNGLAQTFSTLLGRKIRVARSSMLVRNLLLPLGKLLRKPLVAEAAPMFKYFETGRYVADTQIQERAFGKPPTAEDALRRYLVVKGVLPAPVPDM